VTAAHGSPVDGTPLTFASSRAIGEPPNVEALEDLSADGVVLCSWATGLAPRGCPSGQRGTLSAMKETETARLEEEIATLAAHLNAATARLVELVWALGEEGGLVDDVARFVAFRCGIAGREARELVRVAEALRELPATREAFARGELTFTKVRALTRVATPASEEGLLDLAGALTAAQLERALRAFRRLRAEEAGETHALEYVDYHWAEDGSLYVRARLPAEDGVVVVQALEAARERVWDRRREESLEAPVEDAASRFEPARSAAVEALVDVAQSALGASGDSLAARARLVVHVDALALTRDGAGRAELEDGPVIAPETARRLGCDSETVATVERDGFPLSVGRARRTVPPRLRRMLEARDGCTCRWPGCENSRHLDAHHRSHWAHGGETSLDNLVLLCSHHHRLVHEGGYTIEDDADGGLRFRNRHGVLCPGSSRPPPGGADELVASNRRRGLALDAWTNRNGYGDPLDLELAVAAVERVMTPVAGGDM
jgi:hypothetical protein